MGTDKKRVKVKKEGAVYTIILSRPDVHNAIDHQMAFELFSALAALRDDRSAKVGVITGEGRNFCTGGDVKMFLEKLVDDPDARLEWALIGERITQDLIEKNTKPIIAAVNGNCLGGGFEIALACDFIIAADDALFGFPEINLGILPGWGGIARISRRVPPNTAKELVMTGRRITAHEAERYGLVNAVVARTELMKRVMEFANMLAKKSSKSLMLAKMAIESCIATSGSISMVIERGCSGLSAEGYDFKEGVRAFVEKREPVFR